MTTSLRYNVFELSNWVIRVLQLQIFGQIFGDILLLMVRGEGICKASSFSFSSYNPIIVCSMITIFLIVKLQVLCDLNPTDDLSVKGLQL